MGATERVTWAVTRLDRGRSNDGYCTLVLVVQTIPLFATSDKLSSGVISSAAMSPGLASRCSYVDDSFQVNKETPAFFVLGQKFHSFSLTFHAHHHFNPCRLFIRPAHAFVHTFNPLSSACHSQLRPHQLPPPHSTHNF